MSLVKDETRIQSAILEIVQRKDIDPERLEKFLDLQFKAEANHARKAFQQSLALFQGECPIITKTKKVDFTSKSGNRTVYNYSPLDEIVFIIKPILTKYGFSFTFDIQMAENQEIGILKTKIYHSEGHSEEFTYHFPRVHEDQRMNMAQRVKSALTFAKRAALENALGIITAEEDDDARRSEDIEATDKQIKEIKRLIKTTKTDEAAFLTWLKAEDVESLTALDAKKAIHALKQKKAK
jgi:hypothetical protein